MSDWKNLTVKTSCTIYDVVKILQKFDHFAVVVDEISGALEKHRNWGHEKEL